MSFISMEHSQQLTLFQDFCVGGDLATELTRWRGEMPMESVMYNAAHLVSRSRLDMIVGPCLHLSTA